MGRLKATEIRKGNVLELDGELWQIVSYDHSTPGNWRAIIQVKLRHLVSGQSKAIRPAAGDMFEIAFLDTRKCQYLYKDATTNVYVFMDEETYDQHELSEEIAGDAMRFVKEEQVADVTFHDGGAVSVQLPGSVSLKVTESEPAVKGNSVSNIFKRAVVETGLEIKVPLHISVGDVVKINTETCEFQGRSKE